MDSKPLAILLAIIITFGAMGVIVVFGGNTLTGTSTNTELLPSVLKVISIEGDRLEVNAQIKNQGSSTIDFVIATLEIDGKYGYTLGSNSYVSPFDTLIISGSAQGPAALINLLPEYDGIGVANVDAKVVTGIWDIYSGDKVLLRIAGQTTSGDVFERIYDITVQ